ncbi:MAG: 3'-5' exonuclease domain-containing protein 2 [Desulfovibrio sp.]|jgi:ribonuclease D|nr:3'-5' exonuclease domain-containing protein 2 [Desulfovibrio sp.]
MCVDQHRKRLSADEINALPLCSYGGKVNLVRSEADWQEAMPDVKDETLLGFDTETRPSFKKGQTNKPSIVQLATRRAVYIVQLACLPFGAHLAEVLANPLQVKAGVGINDDMRELGRLYSFKPASIANLGTIAKGNRMSSQGLRSLAANLFGRRISKGMQCSNWSNVELTRNQISYAATDAWMGRLIYLRMGELGLVERPPTGGDTRTAVQILKDTEAGE